MRLLLNVIPVGRTPPLFIDLVVQSGQTVVSMIRRLAGYAAARRRSGGVMSLHAASGVAAASRVPAGSSSLRTCLSSCAEAPPVAQGCTVFPSAGDTDNAGTARSTLATLSVPTNSETLSLSAYSSGQLARYSKQRVCVDTLGGYVFRVLPQSPALWIGCPIKLRVQLNFRPCINHPTFCPSSPCLCAFVPLCLLACGSFCLVTAYVVW